MRDCPSPLKHLFIAIRGYVRTKSAKIKALAKTEKSCLLLIARSRRLLVSFADTGAYAPHLRKKAVDACYRGEKKITVCRLMKISRNTLDLWLKREQETGDYRAIAKRPTREDRKIQDLEKFKQFVKQHKDKTQQQMADLWGDNLTQQNISDGIKKLGITRKKKLDAANYAPFWVSRNR